MRRLLLTAAALLLAAAPGTRAASNYTLDLSGNTYTVDTIAAVVDGQADGSLIRLRTVSPGGHVAEEYLPREGSGVVERDPQAVYDPVMAQLLVLWLRTDASGTSLVVASRPAPGLWVGPDSLETGKEAPVSFRAAVDRLSHLHVLWEAAAADGTLVIRHRSFDAVTLDPIAGPSRPFGPDKPSENPSPEGGQDDPGWTGGTQHSTSDVIPSPLPRPPRPSQPAPPRVSSTEYGIVAGCSVPVAYRISGSEVEIASRVNDTWTRGKLSLGADAPDVTRARGFAAEIAQRFCWP